MYMLHVLHFFRAAGYGRYVFGWVALGGRCGQSLLLNSRFAEVEQLFIYVLLLEVVIVSEEDPAVLSSLGCIITTYMNGGNGKRQKDLD